MRRASPLRAYWSARAAGARAAERAAAAFHAEVDLQLGQPLHIARLIGRDDMRWHEPQRTVADAPAAADAGRRLRQDGVCLRHGEDCIRVFQDRLVEVRHGDAHHRAAVEHLLRLRAEAAGLLKHICKLHPNGDDHVLGLRDGGAVDRDALFDQRHTGLAVAGDVASVVQLSTIAPTSQRELAPRGRSRRWYCRSAPFRRPAGYRDFSAQTSMPSSSFVSFRYS